MKAYVKKTERYKATNKNKEKEYKKRDLTNYQK